MKIALDHLLCEVKTQVLAHLATTRPGERSAVLMAMAARDARMIEAALESATPDALLATLIADGTLSRDYEWPAALQASFQNAKRPGAV